MRSHVAIWRTPGDVSLVECHAAVGRYFLKSAASHGIVGTFDYGIVVGVLKTYRPILGVVSDAPKSVLVFTCV